MGIGTGTAMLISSAVGVVGSVAAGNKQEQAQQDAEQEQARLQQEALQQEQRLFEQRALDAESQEATMVEFGAPDDDDEAGTYDDFLTPKSNASGTGLSTTPNSSGLGF